MKTKEKQKNTFKHGDRRCNSWHSKSDGGLSDNSVRVSCLKVIFLVDVEIFRPILGAK